jgi:hypothetical protein
MKVKNTSPRQPAKKLPNTGDLNDLHSLKEKITDLISDDPRKAAIILTDWLNQVDRSTRKKKAG